MRTSHTRPAPGPLALVCLVVVATAVSCGGTSSGASARRRPTTSSTNAGPATTITTPAPTRAVLSTASWTLPRGSARAALVADGDHLLLLGGLDGNRQTTASVLRIEPTTGTVADAGLLAAPVHDTAGALVQGVPMTFGGGASTESSAVQALSGSSARVVGHLPIPRSDLAAVTVGTRTFLVGGYDGATIRATVLATTDGANFARLGDLPTPVRYPAAAALGNEVLVIGGSNGAGAVRDVQAVDVSTGATRLVGQLPATLSDAVAATVHGQVYVFGGMWSGRPSAQVWRLALQPGGSISWSPVAALPTPVVDAAAAVLGDRAFVVGGESPALLRSVSILEVR
jgi:hypothetical protein